MKDNCNVSMQTVRQADQSVQNPEKSRDSILMVNVALLNHLGAIHIERLEHTSALT